jgi:hypothetical protein
MQRRMTSTLGNEIRYGPEEGDSGEKRLAEGKQSMLNSPHRFWRKHRDQKWQSIIYEGTLHTA